MLKMFYPSEYAESVFSVNYKKLFDNGIKAIIFDIDNTLVHHGADSNEKIDRFFSDLHDLGLKTLLLSDNSEERIKRFLKNIDSLYISNADKPKPKSFLKAVELLGVKKDEVIVIGDQIFKDILGANRSGLKSILVKFLRKPEETNFGKRRKAEAIILGFYEKNKKCRHRLGDILIGKED